jgi:hypothetical protein
MSGRRLRLGFALGLVVFASFGARSARAVTVSIDPPDTTVIVGTTFSVRVTTDAFSDLKAFSVIFQYNPSVLQLVGASPGDVLTSSGNPYSAFLVPDNTAPADSAWYDAALLIGSTSGPGILNFFTFKALQTGVSLIECRLVDFRDSQNVQTLPACVGGRVEVTGPTPARRGTWGRIKTLYR